MELAMAAFDLVAVRDSLKTGDVVLFGRRALVPRMPGWLGRPRWTHIGLVLQLPPDLAPALFEVAPGDAGTRLLPLHERLAHFGGHVAVRCLDRPLDGARVERLLALRRELAARRTERNLFDLVGAGDDGWLGGREDNLFAPTAAELAAMAYQRIGLLDEPARGGLPAGRYRPADFGENHRLELKQGFLLGPELPLRRVDGGAGWTGLTPQTA
jgi:hypothetical protein